MTIPTVTTKLRRRLWGPAALVACLALPASAEVDYGARLGKPLESRVTYPAAGTSVLMDALDPTVMRWYMPQEMYAQYNRMQWRYTNYAREPYLRYLSSTLEGSYFYDLYGNLVTRGWLVYDWRQIQPRLSEGSQIMKAAGPYEGWFQRLVVSADTREQCSYSIIVGDEIATTLTPLTFRKAGFNGVVASLATDRLRTTGLFSRISSPVLRPDIVPVPSENFTNLAGGRAELAMTDFFTLGLTYVNAHNGQGVQESFKGNPFTGLLTAGQLGQRLELLVVRLADDSPEDGEGGAVFFAEDIEIATSLPRLVAVGDSLVTVRRDTVIVGSSIGFHPSREGGKLRNGFLTADGAESIALKYTIVPKGLESEEGSLRLLLQQRLALTLSQAEDAISAIRNIRCRLVVANDYRVEVTSDRQTNAVGQPQFLLVERAPGNVKNQLNQKVVVFDYGLPTANQIFGVSAEVRDFKGIDFYGEFDVNTRYRKYPTSSVKEPQAISGIAGDRRAIAWLFNLSKKAYPWSFFVEGFGMDDTYETSVNPVDGRGLVDYSPSATVRLYDFVDDNDDNDRHPDQQRFNQGSLIPPPTGVFTVKTEGVADPAVFPGYDENGDFISDFNQNSNPDRESFYPDYEEPFLRYHSDRPEFLFGLDLNNNGWVDRFENDNLPDYPYKKDHWGHNAFGSVHLTPETRMTLGWLRQQMRKTDGQNHAAYALFTMVKDSSTWGLFRIYDMARLAQDDIRDDLVQWVMPRVQSGRPADTSGRNELVVDPLAAEDTWINTLYADWGNNAWPHWATKHRLKWEVWRQRDVGVEYLRDNEGQLVLDAQGQQQVLFDPLGSLERNGRRDSGFLGVVDKVDYHQQLGRLTVSPKLKSEFLREVPFSRAGVKRCSWDGLLFFQIVVPVLRQTQVELGVEQRFYYDLQADEATLVQGATTGDFSGTVLALQSSLRSAYQGYQLVTQGGLRLDRRSLEVVGGADESHTSGMVFLSVFASRQ
jgi:hypothetical protein